ncbi:MAG: hypothetical protein HOB79_22525 [Rhodospirillaceae bacterium]|nr:hypothetical protein [Rhodospirillaceae bacterium]MBT7486412.1 hypothetical protein [Rhodospirillales bacterium]MBT4703858.1 hypothetical protein [Rhodospirillaceae bacterium]MBT5036441.1 hypothetical protein [Rhodospirillaceae bacterium]MBT6221069.1 hypothetical protein [Rhodospirillaceae bacterium]
MLKRTFRGILHILGGLVAGLVIVVVLLSWRLSAGPVSLAFLSPHIESAFRSFQAVVDVRLDDTVLTWAGWDRTLDIRVVNVRALGGDGKVIASVPEVSLSLSVKAMLKGKVAPRSIELFRPNIHLVRNKDRTFSVGFADGSKTKMRSLQNLLDEFGGDSDKSDVMAYLSRISIVDAGLTIVDETLGTSWSAPATQVQLNRVGQDIKGAMELNLNIDGQQAQFNIEGEYQAVKKRIEIGLSFNEIRPALFSNLSEKVAVLKSVNMPLQGTITMSMLASGTVLAMGFDINGGIGHVVVPPPFDQYLGVRKLEIRGQFDGTAQEINIDNLFVDFGHGQTVFLPAPISHEMPIASVRAKGHYTAERRRLNLSSLKFDLDGPKVNLTSLIDGIGGETIVMSRGIVHNLKIDDFRRYWPRAMGTVPWKWTTTHLSKGIVKETLADVVLRISKAGKVKVESLTGDMQLKNIDVRYMEGMPLVKAVSGTAKFNRERFDIFVEKGKTEGLRITKGVILMSGLDEPDQRADIDLSIEGGLQNHLRLIDHQPLGFSTQQGINPEKTSGDATTHLKLTFPMEETLKRDDIDVLVTAKLREVALPGGSRGDISEGQLDLKLDKTGMDVVGLVKYGVIPATLNWRSNFKDKSSFRQKFALKGRVDDHHRTGQLRLNFAPFTNEYLNGPIDTEVNLTDFIDGTSVVEISADLTRTTFAVAPLGWEKAGGDPGTGRVFMVLKDGELAKISKFTVGAGDLAVDGTVEFKAPGGDLKHIVFSKVKVGKTDMTGIMKPLPRGAWAASFGGKSFDLSSHWENRNKTDTEEEKEKAKDGPKIQLSANFERVWLDDERSLPDVKSNFTREGDIWTRANLTSKIGTPGKNAFSLDIRPGKNGNRRLVIKADDAGSTLKLFDYYENMLNGSLDLKAEYNDSLPSRPLKGRLYIENYRIVKAPVLAKLASVASIVGILENLSGKGLRFLSLELPFKLNEGLLTLKDASAKSISLGLTASGNISMKTDKVNIEGTFVPMYIVNSFFSNIPVLGKLLSGGEKDGGVFAVSYTLKGPVKEPDVGINPLTVFAPGFFRNIFKIFKPGARLPDVLGNPDDDPSEKPDSL